MSKSNSLHCGTILQQRCLHHVSSVCIRNFQLSEDFILQFQDKFHQAFIYFTIYSRHEQQKNNLFKSQMVKFGLNSTWSNLEIPISNSMKLTEFTMDFWVVIKDICQLALQQSIYLPYLICIGDALHNYLFEPNSIIFGLRGLYYCKKDSLLSQSSLDAQPFSLNLSEPKNSYSVALLLKFLNSECRSISSKNKLFDLKKNIKGLRRKQEESRQLEIKVENVKDRIARIRSLISFEEVLLDREKKLSQGKKTFLMEKEQHQKENEDAIKIKRGNIHDYRENIITAKLKLADSLKLFGLRRRNILAELVIVFPITVSTNERSNKSNKTSEQIFSICHVKLPESESFIQREDLATSVALGYVAQLLVMLSEFLLIPLRYSILLKGSYSSIIDHVSDKLIDEERTFPLYVKGNKNRYLSEYGVFLLNKNVAQLRLYYGLGTVDLRPTLENIQSLLIEKLGANVNNLGHSSKPISITESSHFLKEQKKKQSMLESFSKSPTVGDIIMPSGGYWRTLPNPRQNNFSQVEKVPSPIRTAQRKEFRNQDLQTLRGELLGNSERIIRKSPAEQRQNTVLGQYETGNIPNPVLPGPSATTHFPTRLQPDIDSIESVASSNENSALTGLEEIISVQNKKQPYASARAELLGKRADQQSHNSTSWWSRSDARCPSGSHVKKRNELFRKKKPDLPISPTKDSEKFQVNLSNTKNVSTSTTTSLNSVTERTLILPKSDLNPDIRFINPVGNITFNVQSDEEFDLC